MRNILAILLLASALGGCSSDNTLPNTLQFSGGAEAFPAKYAELALKAVGTRPVAGPLLVSYPRPVVGETPFSPHRWFVCIRGLQAPATPAAAPGLLPRLFKDPTPPRQMPGIYEGIVILGATNTPSIRLQFDAEICRDGAFEPLPVPARP